MVDGTHSEGEVLHPRGQAPDSDPILALVSKLQRQRTASPVVEYALPFDPSQVVAAGMDKSLGEVSMGQRPPMDPATESAMKGQQGDPQHLEAQDADSEAEAKSATYRNGVGVDRRGELGVRVCACVCVCVFILNILPKQFLQLQRNIFLVQVDACCRCICDLMYQVASPELGVFVFIGVGIIVVGEAASGESPHQASSSPIVTTVRPQTRVQESDAPRGLLVAGGRRAHPSLGPPVATTTARPQTRRGPPSSQG